MLSGKRARPAIRTEAPRSSPAPYPAPFPPPYHYHNRLVSVSYNLKTYGYRAFSSTAPALLNKLPQNIRRCGCLNQFQKRLVKTFLFKTAFNLCSS